MTKRIVFNPKERDRAISLYHAGYTLQQVANTLSLCCTDVMSDRFREWGIPVRGHRQGRKRKTNIDDMAFSNNDEKSMYWGGFLLADGCVTKETEKGHDRIRLLLKDLDHVRKFKGFLKTDYEVKERRMRKYINYQISVSSRRIANDLKRFGVVPNKTGTVAVPDDNKQIIVNRHFWRGFTDGDGSVFWRRQHRNPNLTYPGFYLCSNSRRILEQFNNFLQYHCLKGLYIGSRSNRKLLQIQATGAPAKKIVQLLYQDATEYLTRKMNIALEILDD